jgi:hypothetical protein
MLRSCAHNLQHQQHTAMWQVPWRHGHCQLWPHCMRLRLQSNWSLRDTCPSCVHFAGVHAAEAGLWPARAYAPPGAQAIGAIWQLRSPLVRHVAGALKRQHHICCANALWQVQGIAHHEVHLSQHTAAGCRSCDAHHRCDETEHLWVVKMGL